MDGTRAHEAKKNATWLIVFGVLTVIFGFLAIASPLVTGLAVSIMVGVLLVFMGVARIVHAFKSGEWGAGIWGTIVGLVAVVAGLVTIFRPGVGLATLTLVLAAYFLVDGICEIIGSFKMKPIAGWGWMLFNGIVAVILGFLIWRQWPVSGAWAIGVLVGIHILLTGITMTVFGFGARRISGKVEDAVEAAGDMVEKAADKVEEVLDDVVDKAQDLVEGDKD